MLDKNKILEALSNVEEPDLGKDLVSLNMIKDLVIEGMHVSFMIELTTPACPMKDMMKNACTNAIHLLVDKQALVNISFGHQALHYVKPKLKQIRNIIMVVSGKGGVGKSTVSSNLALSLHLAGAKVGLLDADIFGPSLPLMFDVKNEKPQVYEQDGKPVIIPIENYGIKLMSIGFLVEDKNAVVWRGPMASSAIKQFFNDVDWGDLDYLIIDMPPGTSDIHLTIMQMQIVTGAIIVTTPQKVALLDAQKGIAMFQQAKSNIPIIGLIENMSYFIPEAHPDECYYIFGKNGGRKLASELDLNFLGEIPLELAICESGDSGKPAVLQDNKIISKQHFKAITDLIIRTVAKINQG
ncbi:MAG: Mrp/NBP35 family ATP-binding protein [Alphaproteobacteria bacterium]|nr:Mrp/NBP35 family ATP-binding protein [Alphaproteobacteria bacterium]